MNLDLETNRTDDNAPPDRAPLFYKRLSKERYSKLAVQSYCSQKRNTTHMERSLESGNFHSKRTRTSARACGKQNKSQMVSRKQSELPDTPWKSKRQNKCPLERGNNKRANNGVQQRQPRDLRHVVASSSKHFISSHSGYDENVLAKAPICSETMIILNNDYSTFKKRLGAAEIGNMFLKLSRSLWKAERERLQNELNKARSMQNVNCVPVPVSTSSIYASQNSSHLQSKSRSLVLKDRDSLGKKLFHLEIPMQPAIHVCTFFDCVAKFAHL